MSKWTWENEVGDRDEWWSLYCDGEYIGRVETEAAAVRMTNVLNRYPVIVEGLKKVYQDSSTCTTFEGARKILEELKDATIEAAKICEESHEKGTL